MSTEDIVGIIIAAAFGIPLVVFFWLMMLVGYKDILSEIRKGDK